MESEYDLEYGRESGYKKPEKKKGPGLLEFYEQPSHEDINWFENNIDADAFYEAFYDAFYNPVGEKERREKRIFVYRLLQERKITANQMDRLVDMIQGDIPWNFIKNLIDGLLRENYNN